MYGYIYKTTNLINNKIYIGQHKHKNFDINYFGSGILIKKAINKYGKNNFKCEILEECESLEELNKKEIYWISKLKPVYNISSGGLGGLGNHFHLSKEAKLKISKAHKGKPKKYKTKGWEKGNIPWNKDKHWSEEARQHISLGGKEIHKQQRWINNGKINKFVHISKLDEYLNNGWIKGRLWITNLDDYKKKMSISIKYAHENGKINNKGKFCWVNKNNKRKMIKIKDLNEYINNGWVRGKRR